MPHEEAAPERTVMFGDSITYMCDWQSHFEGSEVINLGVSGDTVGDLIDRIDEVYHAAPSVIFIMAGVNDLLSGREPDDIIADWQTLLDLTRDYKVYVQSMLPVDAGFGDRALLVSEFNAKLKALCAERGTAFIDLYSLYCDSNGFLKQECTPDGLHIKASAYEPWIKKIRPIIEGSGK